MIKDLNEEEEIKKISNEYLQEINKGIVNNLFLFESNEK